MPNHLDKDTVPINKFAVHSIFVSPEPGQTVDTHRKVAVQGLAMDSGPAFGRLIFPPMVAALGWRPTWIGTWAASPGVAGASIGCHPTPVSIALWSVPRTTMDRANWKVNGITRLSAQRD
jgi:hypothetical protein